MIGSKMALSLNDVTIAYGRQPAVHHVSGQFAAGALTAIVGPNGAGKSSLLKAMAGLLPLESGHIDWGSFRPQDLAYLPQLAEIDRAFPITLHELVRLGRWRQRGSFRRWKAADDAAAASAIAQLGLAALAKRPIAQLSVGQFQRALFARLLLQDAPLILLDEPFNAVDAQTTADLLALLQQWRGQGRTVICVLHDLDLVRRHFPHTLLLARELVAWGDSPTVLSPQYLTQANVAMAQDRLSKLGYVC
jgi:zinc/manganese transport system ATP-binding protein